MNANSFFPARFSIILVNYKTLEMTRKCLHFLRESLKNLDADVWVVDNNSDDDSTVFLRQLDWIKLIERHPERPEPGYVAHGMALDLALAHIETDYVFVMHTDTMIYDPDIFGIMLKSCCEDADSVAAGCVDQVHRGKVRSCWRVANRFMKHYSRRMKLALGITSRPPKAYVEHYLKSFFTLWNARILKQHQLAFSRDDKSPGYAAQDKLIEMGYKIERLPTKTVFRYLDHLQGGTKALGLGIVKDRRLRKSRQVINQLMPA